MNEIESRKKKASQGPFATKKVKTVLEDDEIAPNVDEVSANTLKVNYGLAARTALQKVQQKLATKEVEHWLRSN